MYYLGVDVGSVSTDIAIIDENLKLVEGLYLRTKGRPIETIQEGVKILSKRYSDCSIRGVGTTGSGRSISSFLIGADIVKNEITAHAVAALSENKNVRTVIEIGGQDSKIILLKDGVVTDFAMNTVCAAGTGSFLDRQAERLEIPIENFGNYALSAKSSVRIAGRCAVFAESDMIHKQQMGYSEDVIIKGLCDALVRNYLNNVAKGKEIEREILFQGGVAANCGIKAAFEEALKCSVTIPENYKMMGAIGAAILAKEHILLSKSKTAFKGFSIGNLKLVSDSFECKGCSNHCEIIKLLEGSNPIGCFGDRCGKHSEKFSVKKAV